MSDNQLCGYYLLDRLAFFSPYCEVWAGVFVVSFN